METIRYDKIDETLVTETLPNGLRICVVPKKNFSKTFAMFATNYGGADRRFQLGGQWIDTPAGVAHYLEHKMFDMPDGNALLTLSACGANVNAFTSSSMTAYHFESTTRFEENLQTLLRFVSTPYFTPESVQKERGIIGQEIRMVEDSPGFVLYTNLLKCLYASNPVRDSVAGTVDSIAEITPETLTSCHRVFYNPSNMTLAVVGNADPASVIEMAKAVLPAEPGEVPQRDYGEKETAFPHIPSSDIQMEVSAPQFLLGAKLLPAQKGRSRLHQSLVGELALKYLLGSSSPLYHRLYVDGLLNGEFEYELDYTAGTAMLVFGGESRDVSGVVDAFNAEITRISQDGVDEALFENTRRSYYGSMLRVCGSFSALAQSLVGGVFADHCPLDVFDELQTVSAADIAAFISENLDSKKLALSVVRPL
ncbi:MAG: EF-P 5-aminopentanol modification-associated protein YfmH [Oscillospiraceae bacterium]|jgi:predicted Zn-dependent peptidase